MATGSGVLGMGVIVNPRGTSGSGKTELARRILADYGWSSGGGMEPIRRAGRARPIGFQLRHPLGGRPLAVLGYYGAETCGGCDTIPARDGGLDAVFRLADWLATTGHDVLLEGLFLSAEYRRTAELARRHPLHVLRLDTPVERCARNLLARQRRSGALRPLVAEVVAAQRDAVEDVCARLRCCAASVETLDFDEALRRARELLGLRPAATGGGPWRWPAGTAANFGDTAPVTARSPN
jgi:predicted kinase